MPGGDQVLPGVTSCDQFKCFGVTEVAKTVFWGDRSAINSVLALRELQKQCFGVTGVAKTVFWRDRSCKSSVLV